jgi:hypothetical protein
MTKLDVRAQIASAGLVERGKPPPSNVGFQPVQYKSTIQWVRDSSGEYAAPRQ